MTEDRLIHFGMPGMNSKPLCGAELDEDERKEKVAPVLNAVNCPGCRTLVLKAVVEWYDVGRQDGYMDFVKRMVESEEEEIPCPFCGQELMGNIEGVDWNHRLKCHEEVIQCINCGNRVLFRLKTFEVLKLVPKKIGMRLPQKNCYDCRFIEAKDGNKGYVCVESIDREELPIEMTCEHFQRNDVKETQRQVEGEEEAMAVEHREDSDLSTPN